MADHSLQKHSWCFSYPEHAIESYKYMYNLFAFCSNCSGACSDHDKNQSSPSLRGAGRKGHALLTRRMQITRYS